MFFTRMPASVGTFNWRLTRAALGLAAACGLAVLTPRTLAATIYVDGTNGDDAWSGLCVTWEGGLCGPKRTIQAGINAAVGGDEVLLADGVYAGTGNRDLDFAGKAITLRSASAQPATCIVDCERQGRGLYFHSGEGAGSVVLGLTVCNGFSDSGGGVFCEGACPSLIDCIITANTASVSGGGVTCSEADALLVKCRITGNTARSGGGVYCSHSDATLVNCTISGNDSSYGGGVSFGYSEALLTNCTITGNTAVRGGGISCGNLPGSCPTLTNCILWADAPEEIYAYAEAAPIVSYCDVQGGWPGAGNINHNPRFAFPDDFHLLGESACIDKGTNSPPGGLPPDDIEGQPRPLDGEGFGRLIADMGAYEFNRGAPAIAVSASDLTFLVPRGESAAQTFEILNSSLGTLAWQLDWEVPWLSASPGSGESSGEADVVTVTVEAGGQALGRCDAPLWVVDPQAGNSPCVVGVVVYVTCARRVPEEYATIQAAIDAAGRGDEVVIADGVYTGPGNRDLDFRGKAITVRSASDQPITCVIDCQHEGRGFYFHTTENVDSVVRGLTVRNGYGGDGGGVCCVQSSPTLVNCRVMACTAYNGGGVSCYNCSHPTLTDCVISGNMAIGEGRRGGGGVWCKSSACPTLTNCTITSNQAVSDGGGVQCSEYSSPTLANCRLIGNTTLCRGGGLYCIGECNPRLINCTFIGNTAYGGGGVFGELASRPTLTNCALTGNTASAGGGGIACDSSATLTNCILWADAPEEIYPWGAPAVTYCAVQGGWPGTGNIDSNPEFAFPHDLHLMPGSPCIDAGTNSPPGGLPPQDIEGQPRAIDGDGNSAAVADMGPYEFDPATPAIALDPTELVFLVLQGQSASQTLSVLNSSLGTLSWTLDWHPEWLSACPASGESSGEIDLVNLTVDTAGVAQGADEAILWVSDAQASNSPRAVSIVLYVNNELHVPAEYTTIQAAIDAAVPGNEVVIDDGVYAGPGNRNLDFHGKDITVRSASDNPQTCIIDCQRAGRGFYFHNGETAAAVVRGLTICNGISSFGGGGIYCRYSSPTVTSCTISGNASASIGGGVYCDTCNPMLNNCTICANTSGGTGGGVSCDEASPILTNCAIVGNTAERGAGVSSGLSTPVLINCTITGNAASVEGGGLATADYGWSYRPTLTNCILWADTPQEIDVDGTNPILTYCDVQGGWEGAGNIDVDPGFAFQRDPRLMPGSACIDAGTNDPPGGLPPQDCEDQPRPVDGDGDGQAFADMGACEHNPAAPSIALSATELILSVPEGQSASATLGIRNSSAGLLGWELSWQGEWLTADRRNGESGGEVETVTVTVDSADLPHGQYGTALWVSDPQASNSPRAISLIMYVNRWLHVPEEYATIQAAIDAAIPGDEVVLADGEYTGVGNRDLNFRGKAIIVRSAGDNPGACIIDCQQQGRGFLFQSRETAASVVQGFTIRNGSADYGGGANCDSASPTFANCAFTGNTANSGGGMYFYASAPTVANCVVDGNAANYNGGGLVCSCSVVTLTDCRISNNTAGSAGGGAYCMSSVGSRFTNCTIAGNTATQNGGGAYDAMGGPWLTNCAILGNTAGACGGGLCYYLSDDVRLTNCTVAGNAAVQDGGGIDCSHLDLILDNCTLTGNTAGQRGGAARGYSCSPTLTNCVLSGDLPQEIYSSFATFRVTYSDVQGGFTGVGNINVDPLFADPHGPDGDPATWADNDYRLTAGSPCIDAGQPDFAPLPGVFDPDGHARVWDGDDDGQPRIDMGVYEFGSGPYLNGDLNCDGLVNVFDIDPFILALFSAPYFEEYHAPYPDCSGTLADMNCDGAVNALDIDPFVIALTGG